MTEEKALTAVEKAIDKAYDEGKKSSINSANQQRELVKFMEWIIKQKPRYNWMSAISVVKSYVEDNTIKEQILPLDNSIGRFYSYKEIAILKEESYLDGVDKGESNTF